MNVVNFSRVQPDVDQAERAPKFEKVVPGGGNALGRRALVAEDNRLTRDLLKLLLNQRGHDVDVATDGQQALAALRRNAYDVAFLDYNLPLIGGSKVASTLRREAGDRKLPRMIAITDDLKALLAKSGAGDSLDQLLLLDIDSEKPAQSEPTELATGHAPGHGTHLSLVPAAKFAKAAHRSAFENLGYNFLTWPGDIELGRLSTRAMRASLGDPHFDGIVILEPTSVERIGTLWAEPALYALPIIDLTGEAGAIADFNGSALAAIETGKLDEVIQSFRDRRERLHRDILLSTDRAEQLMGRLFVANKPLTPQYSPDNKWLTSYDMALPTSVIAREAKALCDRGLLRREFFERFHVCPSCDSRRLHVREECSQCGSSDLEEGQYIHHFACAHLALESDFRQGDSLICPKCSQELTHFGHDYDRPGTMVSCRSCGHADAEPSVGFVCLDCHTHVDGETAATRDVYSYSLTDEGMAFAQYGRAMSGTASHALRFADLPFELVAALNAATKRYEDDRTPFMLATIAYHYEKEVTFEHGPRAFAGARDLFLENLRNLLGDIGTVVSAQSRDFVLCPGISAESTKDQFDVVVVSAQETLRHQIGAVAQAFGPEAFA